MFNQKLTTALFAVALLFSWNAAFAQVTVWGAGSADVHTDSVGRFASADGTLGSLGWTLTSAYTPQWEYTPTGASASLAAADTLFSPSWADGSAMFDGFYHYFNDTTATGDPKIQEAYLTSPVIDLSAYADSILTIEGYARTVALNEGFDGYTVEVSLDSGATWTILTDFSATTDLPTLGAFSNGVLFKEGFFSLNFTRPLREAAANQSLENCFIRFYYNDYAYFYGVDDISIKTNEPYSDIRLASISQVSDEGTTNLRLLEDTDNMFWGGTVDNIGSENIAGSTLSMYIEVLDPSGNVAVLDTLAITDAIPAYYVPDSSSTTLEGTINGWLPTVAGTYTVNQWVAYDQAPASGYTPNANDSMSTQFVVTEDMTLSKTFLDADGYPVTSGSGALLNEDAAGQLPGVMEWGSMYYIPNYAIDPATEDSLMIDSMSYMGYTPSSATIDPSLAGGLVSIATRIYEVADTDSTGLWTQDPASAFDPELILSGIGNDTVALVAGDSYQRRVNIVGLNSVYGVTLKPNTAYVATVIQSDVINGLRTANGEHRGMFISIAEAVDYTDNFVVQEDNSPSGLVRVSPTVLRTGYIGTSGLVGHRWYNIGYGLDAIPAISLNLATKFPVNVTQNPDVTTEFSIFPNPATEQITAKVELTEMNSNVQYIITDATGRMIINEQKNDLQSDVVTYDVSNLPAGVYFFSVRTAKGASSQKFVKQ
ncbi:T9SS type A sorting domain-containing protein [Saprospira sp. CCB-QB6]|uniref:T9SS type A sorting domain-containing protein n=1 Tax=Saprospira sp. CCB-QB6 TaxID=3023936 RepID=UPI00234966C0|nr:T9SS type A sorting domain-containing protein [Saprospira sp. CCB-QB6]WCL82773.1 T9SS type A sorting domain-containing protein [Saprospira sp. CCB-QB6]